MRCFIALPIPEEAKERISEAISTLKRANPGLKWVSAEAYHLTLAFLGDIDEPRLACAKKAAEGVSDTERFQAVFGGLLVFPPRGDLRVLSLDIRSGEGECARVHRKVNEALAEAGRRAGFPGLNPEWPTGRPFKAHLTLARAGRDSRRPDFRAFPAEFQAECEISSCIVYESILGRGGAMYMPLHEAALAGSAR